MFVWKAFSVVVICSGREEEVRGEGALGGRRRECDQMWAYGQLCGRNRVVCGCELGVREGERVAREILFGFPRGPVVTSELSLHVCHILIMWETHVARRDM